VAAWAILSPEPGLWFLDLFIALLADVHPIHPLVRALEFQLSWLNCYTFAQVPRDSCRNQAKGCFVERGQQKRSHRRTQAGRALTHQPTQAGLPRRTRNSHAERTGARLSHRQQRCHSHDEPDQIAVSQLGHSLSWNYGLCSPSSARVAG